ncbi:MAG: PIN domain-containing protein [Ignavibacteriales bacterium]|nr:PIN domain-containing protein [Ignavibacteriales bacterium]
MKILVDTNVVLDVMLDREPFSLPAAILLSKVESKKLVGFLGATTITTIYYIARKTVGSEQARTEIDKLFKLFEVAPIDKPILESAVKSEISDFEDAVLHEAGKNVEVDAIVTRNPKDFKKGTLPVYSSEELLKLLEKEDSDITSWN